MNERVLKSLHDILEAINQITTFCSGATSYEEFASNELLKSAVERKLGIIGEAANRIEREQAGISLSDQKRMIAFRNRLIHAYDTLDSLLVWGIVVNELPELENEVKALLRTSEP